MGQKNQKSRSKYWAIHSSIRMFARTAHSFTCFALLASFACSAALTYLFARSLTWLTPKLVGKWMIKWLFFLSFLLFWTIVRRYNFISLVLFCFILVKISDFSEIQLVYDGRTDKSIFQTRPLRGSVRLHAINYEWNEYNFYCSKLTRDNNLRFFSLKSLKAAVLLWMGPGS